MSYADEVIIDSLKGEVLGLLEQCTESERDFFYKRCFPETPKNLDGVSVDVLKTAVNLCKRTVTTKTDGVGR